jgi:hypothetical protein
MTVARSVTNLSGGRIALTAVGNGGDDDHLTVAAPIFAAGAGGDVQLDAGTDLILRDTPAANDLEGASITGTAERDLIYEEGFVVRSSTGAVTNPVSLVENVVTPQVKSTGFSLIEGDIGRPGDETFVYRITWDVEGPVEDNFDSGDPVFNHEQGRVTGTAPEAGPDHFSFDHRHVLCPWRRGRRGDHHLAGGRSRRRAERGDRLRCVDRGPAHRSPAGAAWRCTSGGRRRPGRTERFLLAAVDRRDRNDPR